jgi:hypothetical protein
MSRSPLPTEEEIVSRLRGGEVAFPPLRLGWKESKAKGVAKAKGVVGVVRLSWRKQGFTFVAECKRRFDPRTIAVAAEQARKQAEVRKGLPLVVVPFLDGPALDALEARAVSGIDLCGNGLVIVPGT